MNTPTISVLGGRDSRPCRGYYYDGIDEALRKGNTYGAPTEIEIRVAEMIIDAYPSMDMVRMVNSGTEATMSAIRLARGYTGREIHQI